MATEGIYNKARQAANMGNYEYAIELFREVLRHEPEHPDARLLLRGTERRRASEKGGVAARTGAYFKAVIPLVKSVFFLKKKRRKLELFEDALESLPNSIHISICAGNAARKAGLPEAAIALFKDVIARSPENKKALRHAGELLQGQGETREALKFLNRLHRLEPSDRDLAAQVKNLEAEAHMKDSKMDEAESFRDMIKDSDAAEQSVRRFETADEKRARQIQEALGELRKEPENVSKIIRMAVLLEDDKQYEKALQLLKKARQKHVGNFEIRQKFGDLQIRRLQRGERELKEKMEESPDNAGIKEKLEKIAAKRREIAVREYKWRVESHPTDRPLKMKLGHALYENGDIDAAIASFQQAGQDPNLAIEAASMLGRCFARKKQYDLAVEQFRRALSRHDSMDRRGMELYYELAGALEDTGKMQEALDIYKKLYSNDIGFKDVAEKVEKLKKNSSEES